MMTRQQIRWAAQHDWFIEGFDGAVLVRDYYPDGTPFERTFNDIKLLRMWANY